MRSRSSRRVKISPKPSGIPEAPRRIEPENQTLAARDFLPQNPFGVRRTADFEHEIQGGSRCSAV